MFSDDEDSKPVDTPRKAHNISGSQVGFTCTDNLVLLAFCEFISDFKIVMIMYIVYIRIIKRRTVRHTTTHAQNMQ